MKKSFAVLTFVTIAAMMSVLSAIATVLKNSATRSRPLLGGRGDGSGGTGNTWPFSKLRAIFTSVFCQGLVNCSTLDNSGYGSISR